MPEIKYEITEHLGVISETARGWTREVNMISWNGREPKIDVRDWNPDHSKMSKGLTFTVEEVKKRLRANSNYDMSIDYLLMNMWKEINGERSSRY